VRVSSPHAGRQRYVRFASAQRRKAPVHLDAAQSGKVTLRREAICGYDAGERMEPADRAIWFSPPASTISRRPVRFGLIKKQLKNLSPTSSFRGDLANAALSRSGREIGSRNRRRANSAASILLIQLYFGVAGAAKPEPDLRYRQNFLGRLHFLRPPFLEQRGESMPVAGEVKSRFVARWMVGKHPPRSAIEAISQRSFRHPVW